ncbi:MAG: hydantoinase/oxoprolinase family protein [Pseudomonadota bacterium]
MTQTSIRIGVDIGGTFTDVALARNTDLFTNKVLTNYDQPEQAILDGIEKTIAEAGIAPADINQVIHGTTLVTNALIERRGAKLAFITTEGFRDVVEMRSENRFEQYDLNLELPKPLVGRPDRYTLNERVAADGSVLLPIDPDELDELVETILSQDYEAIAIGFMHAYANDAHERKVEAALRKVAPEISISMSSVVSPQMREFERFNTVIANAYVQPQVADYLQRLVGRLSEQDINAPVYMMHSGGGLISVETASAEPVRLLESGPAGGAIFAANFALAHNLDKVLSFDMGGTTAKICLIEEGTPKTANTFEVARTYRFKKGSGMPVSTPVVEMVEIGAGGGSIASLDAMGQIRVGPRSAASEPGPACYQRGGEEPTVSDANLVLGRLDADNFAGGAIPLSNSLAKQAMLSRIGDMSGLSAAESAFGVTEMVDENMANAARVHAVENGRDIETFTMVAFGGGAPLHACRQCEKLGISSLIIPPGAGVGSAIGFLKAPFSYEASAGLFQRLAEFQPDLINQRLQDLENEAHKFVAEGAGDSETRVKLTAFMRYSGQGWEIPVVVPFRKFDMTDKAELAQAFEAAYQILFGRTIEDLSIEITNWSVTVSTVLPEPEKAGRFLDGIDQEGSKTRQFFDAALRRDVNACEVQRNTMEPGISVEGPAVIVESETTTIVTSGYRAIGQGDGSLLLLRKGAEQ